MNQKEGFRQNDWHKTSERTPTLSKTVRYDIETEQMDKLRKTLAMVVSTHVATTIEVMSHTVILYDNTPLHERPSLFPCPVIGDSWRSPIIPEKFVLLRANKKLSCCNFWGRAR
jgi:hypothetical protein